LDDVLEAASSVLATGSIRFGCPLLGECYTEYHTNCNARPNAQGKVAKIIPRPQPMATPMPIPKLK